MGADIQVGTHPIDLALSADGKEVWTTDLDSASVSIIDVASRTSQANAVAVGGGPSGIAFTPCGSGPAPTTTTTASTPTTAPATTAAAAVVVDPRFTG